MDDYVVDLVAESPAGDRHFLEVLTGHHNWELHRSTYRKLADLNQDGSPVVAFDARDTAYDIYNHWHRAGLGELPLGPLDSTPRIAWGREKIQEAYAEASTDWVIVDWFTTDWLWRHTFGPKGPAVDETAVKVNGEQSWLYDAIETGTKLLLDVAVLAVVAPIQQRRFCMEWPRDTISPKLCFSSMATAI